MKFLIWFYITWIIQVFTPPPPSGGAPSSNSFTTSSNKCDVSSGSCSASNAESIVAGLNWNSESGNPSKMNLIFVHLSYSFLICFFLDIVISKHSSGDENKHETFWGWTPCWKRS